MQKLNAKTKDGEQLGYEDGIIYKRGNLWGNGSMTSEHTEIQYTRIVK